MRDLIRFLMENWIFAVIVLGWIAGAIGNVLKAAKKARERAGREPRPQPVERPVMRSEAPAQHQPQPRSIRSEEIADEMRRILRGEPSAGDTPSHAPRPHAPESPPPIPHRPRPVVVVERPPAPVLPSARRLPIHVESHVGDSIARRATVGSGVGSSARGQGLGQLGGRTHATVHRDDAGRRYALTDLKRVIVLNEILGPPLALRGGAGREV